MRIEKGKYGKIKKAYRDHWEGGLITCLSDHIFVHGFKLFTNLFRLLTSRLLYNLFCIGRKSRVNVKELLTVIFFFYSKWVENLNIKMERNLINVKYFLMPQLTFSLQILLFLYFFFFCSCKKSFLFINFYFETLFWGVIGGTFLPGTTWISWRTTSSRPPTGQSTVNSKSSLMYEFAHLEAPVKIDLTSLR